MENQKMTLSGLIMGIIKTLFFIFLICAYIIL